MDSIVFEKEYEIRSYDTGTNGKLRPDALLSYLQDIAGHHASVLHFGREELNKQRRFWVLVRILCRIKATPVWNENITIKTWPRSVEGLFAIRNFMICNSEGENIGEASSSWVIVDSDTRRPLRPDAALYEFGKESPFQDFNCPLADKLPEPGSNAYKSPLKTVRYSDLDVNMHVNNARYLQWLIDSYPLDFIMKHEASIIEANYNSETTAGDEFIVTAEENASSFYHSVIKSKDEKEACRFRIEWKSGVDGKV
jgi:acyl-ACP thioesterase